MPEFKVWEVLYPVDAKLQGEIRWIHVALRQSVARITDVAAMEENKKKLDWLKKQKEKKKQK